MNVPTNPTTPGAHTYTPYQQYAPAVSQTVGNLVGSLVGQGAAVYDFVRARRPIDQVLAVNDFLAAAASLTPIGPFVQVGALAKHLTVMYVDKERSRQKARSILRQIRYGIRYGHRLAREGQAPEVAAFATLRRVAPVLWSAGFHRFRRELRASPFYAPGAGPDVMRDPGTGQLATLAQLRAKYGPGYQERLGEFVNRELGSRYAPAGGLLPGLLAPRRLAA